jgi:uncharacterized protein (DUF1015 family)
VQEYSPVPKIEPFHGVHYNPLRTWGLSPVIGPPQDLPDLEEAARLISQHPYHSLRLELGDPSEDKWASPAQVRSRVFERWLADGVLVRSDEPVFFIHEHRYRQDGVYHRRLGLFVTADLAEDQQSGFRPHEATLRENLRFRVELLRQLKLSISPIFTLIRDTGWLGMVLADIVQGRPPDLSGHDIDEGVHRVWSIRDTSLIRWFQDLVADRPLYIADGHHRFGAARAYREYLLDRGIDPGPASRVLTLIVSEFDPGVSILPIHREIRDAPLRWEDIEHSLDELFRIECVLTEDQVDPDLVGRRARKLAESYGEEHSFLMIRSDDRRLMRLTLRDETAISRIIDRDVVPEVRDLDATILHRILLEHVLGIGAEESEDVVSYSHDASAITRRVQAGESSMGLFMRNPRIEQVLAVADAGAHMPQKSTYFFPKVPAGLVMYDLG